MKLDIDPLNFLQYVSWFILFLNLIIYIMNFKAYPKLKYYIIVAFTWIISGLVFYAALQLFEISPSLTNDWSTMIRIQTGLLLFAVGVSLWTQRKRKKK